MEPLQIHHRILITLTEPLQDPHRTLKPLTEPPKQLHNICYLFNTFLPNNTNDKILILLVYNVCMNIKTTFMTKQFQKIVEPL